MYKIIILASFFIVSPLTADIREVCQNSHTFAQSYVPNKYKLQAKRDILAAHGIPTALLYTCSMQEQENSRQICRYKSVLLVKHENKLWVCAEYLINAEQWAKEQYATQNESYAATVVDHGTPSKNIFRYKWDFISGLKNYTSNKITGNIPKLVTNMNSFSMETRFYLLEQVLQKAIADSHSMKQAEHIANLVKSYLQETYNSIQEFGLCHFDPDKFEQKLDLFVKAFLYFKKFNLTHSLALEIKI